MIPFFEDFQNRVPSWLDARGPSGDIVVSTRARLARNLKTFPFPHHASVVELGTIYGDLARRLPKFPAFSGGWLLNMAELDATMHTALREMNLASRELVTDPQHRGLVISRDLALSGMINEKDHVRLVAFRAGFDPDGTLSDVLQLDDFLDSAIDPAFAEDMGYLTASPVDVGTGLDLSALIHLPGLVLAGEIDKVLNALRQLQFSVRGLSGDGGTVRGALFRISNLITLGRDEMEIADDFRIHVGKILTYERAARDQLYARDTLGIEDMAHRSLAALQSARLITSQETFDRLSHVRLGASLDVLGGISPKLLNTALIGHQTAHLEHFCGGPLPGKSKAEARASFLRELFGD